MADKLTKITEDVLEVATTVVATLNRADLLIEREVLANNLGKMQENLEAIDAKLAVLDAK